MLFVFEKPYFDEVGLDAVLVGHPVAERGLPDDAVARFRAAHDIGPDEAVVCLLPGSRMSEVTRLLPVFRSTAEQLLRTHPRLRFVLPTVAHVEPAVRQAVAAWPVAVTVLVGSEDEKHAAFHASTVALAASGTVALELAAAGLPAVIAYRTHPVTAAIIRRVVRVPYVSMVNLIEGREVMPEFLQEYCTAQNLTQALARLLDDNGLRASQKAAMGRVMTALGRGGEPPHLRAARAVLEMLSVKPA
jgi:lipid-A-disaccharide synthase